MRRTFPPNALDGTIRFGDLLQKIHERETDLVALANELVRFDMRSPFVENMLKYSLLHRRQPGWRTHPMTSVSPAYEIDCLMMHDGDEPCRKTRLSRFGMASKSREAIGGKIRAHFCEY